MAGGSTAVLLPLPVPPMKPTDPTSFAAVEATPNWRRVAFALLVIAFAVGYQLLVHRLIATGSDPLITMLAGLLPFALLFTAMALSAGWRFGAALVPICMYALAWHWRVPLQGGFGWIYVVEHVSTQLLLGYLFARTLAPGQTALITQFARRVHGGVLAPAQQVYTRRATLAWALFFALDALISLALFVFAPLSVWSVFANLLTLPLVAAMFIGEYLVRRLLLPDMPHVSIAAGVRAFWTRDDVAGDAQSARAPVAPH